jgi:tetratricopeptide (TPR) repeat protein
MAYSYLEQFKVLTGKDRPEERDQAPRFASKHLAEARKHDPYASVSVIEGKQTVTYTFDQLAARALYFEGLIASNSEYDQYRAKHAFEKAASYQPHDPAHYIELAKVYVRQYQRAKALEALHQALTIDPSYFPAIDLLNKFQDNSDIGIHPHYFLVISVVKLAIFIIVSGSVSALLINYYDILHINPAWTWLVIGILFIMLYLIPWRELMRKPDNE